MLTTANTQLKIDGAPALLDSDVHAVAGCPFTIPPGKPSPCVKIEWSLGAILCKSDRGGVLTQSSIGRCISAEGATQGLAIVVQTQMKIQAT